MSMNVLYIVICVLVLCLLLDTSRFEGFTPWAEVNPRLLRRYLSSPGV